MPRKGYKQTPEHVEKHRLVVTGKKHTDEWRKNHSKRMTNEKHPEWRGDSVGYSGLHRWMKRHKPKPELCERCKSSSPVDLANISGRYLRDVNDFEWLCRSCHNKLHHVIDMSDIICHYCGTKKTRMRKIKMGLRGRWYFIEGKRACSKCYEGQYNKKYREVPEHKEKQKQYMKKYNYGRKQSNND